MASKTTAEVVEMVQSLSNILVHIVFSTKGRRRWLKQRFEPRLAGYFRGIGRNTRCPVLAVGMDDDHVHLLVRLARTMALATLVEALKGESSRWLKTCSNELHGFAWQGGYAAFSVSPRHVDRVVTYLRNQRAHHRRTRLERELEALSPDTGPPLSPATHSSRQGAP